MPPLQVEQLFGIGLRIALFFLQVAVSQGNQRKAHLIETAEAVIRDIPSEHVVPDLVKLVSLLLPLLRCEIAEGRQRDPIIADHAFHLFQRCVDFTAFHAVLLRPHVSVSPAVQERHFSSFDPV